MGAKRQSPIEVDPATDELITHGAHFLGIAEKDLVAEAVKDYLAARREEIHQAMTEATRCSTERQLKVNLDELLSPGRQ